LNKNLIILIILALLIFLIVGCSQSIEIPEENEPAELSEEEKLEQLKIERENLEKDRKEEMGEFYIPLPALGEERELQTVKAKALYLTGNVSGFKFLEEDIWGMIVFTPIVLAGGFYTLIKTRKYCLKNLAFLRNLHDRLCNMS